MSRRYVLVRMLFSISLLAFAPPLPAGQTEFLEAPQYATGPQPQSVAIGDFNGDGNPDLAIADLGSNNVSLLLGRGDGSFRPRVDYPTGAEPSAVVVGDFNG